MVDEIERLQAAISPDKELILKMAQSYTHTYQENERLRADLAQACAEIVHLYGDIEQLREALRPFAGLFLYPDDLGFEASSDIKDDSDWDADANDLQSESYFILRLIVRRARAALVEKTDD